MAGSRSTEQLRAITIPMLVTACARAIIFLLEMIIAVACARAVIIAVAAFVAIITVIAASAWRYTSERGMPRSLVMLVTARVDYYFRVLSREESLPLA